jgi:Tol biopolymer transport system component
MLTIFPGFLGPRTVHLGRLVTVALAVTVGAAGVTPVDAEPLGTTVVSVAADGHAAGGSLLAGGFSNRQVSGDGNYVVFRSSAGTFGPRDGNGNYDIYLRDRKRGEFERITEPGAVWINGASDRPTITPDGRYVAFDSMASTLVVNDTNQAPDVFVRDRQSGLIERVSVGSSEQQGDYGSQSPSISDDGRYVAFNSSATTFAAGTSQLLNQVYLRDRVNGTTTLVSVNTAGNKGNATSLEPSISGNGRYVAFMSAATNLAPGVDANGTWDVFVRDRQAGTTVRVSNTPDGSAGNSPSMRPAISLDGRFVAYYTEASDIKAGLTGLGDIVVRNLQTGTTERITVATDGGPTDANFTGSPSITADGRYIAFYSDASNLITGDTNGVMDVYVRDRVAKTTERVSVSSTQGTGPSGERVSISGNGRVIAFNSWSPDLVSNDFNNDGDVYVHERVTGTEALTIQPWAMAFGQIEVGQSQSDVFRLNNSGTVSFNILRMGIRGTDRTQFLPTNHCGTEIVAGTSCEVVITFKPTSVGFKEARLRVELASGTVIWRNISGTGVAP